MAQLSDLAEVISNKLQPLAFGQHLAIQLTRIREFYFNSGIEIPKSVSDSLHERLSVEHMVEVLDAAQQALRNEATVAYIKGFVGLGGIAALLMALCPDDILLLVEDTIIHRGLRRSIIISVKHTEKTTLSIEKTLRQPLPLAFRVSEFLASPGRISSYEHCTMKIPGCLARMVQQLFENVTFRPADDIIFKFANLIGVMMCSFTGNDFGSKAQFPRDGLRSLLGPRFSDVVQEKLGLLFDTRVLLENPDPVHKYKALCQSVANLVPDSACQCYRCADSHNWATVSFKRGTCPLHSIWAALQTLVGHAVLHCLVDTDLEVLRIVQYTRIKMGHHLCHRLMQYVMSSLEESSLGVENPEVYSVQDLHTDMCQLFGSIPSNEGGEYDVLGTSNGATTTVPATLDTVLLGEDHITRYRVFDGQFHDGRSYYAALIEDAHTSQRPLAEESVILPTKPYRAGKHSDLAVSFKPSHNSLNVRTMIEFRDKCLNVSFHSLHLAYMATSISTPCYHELGDLVTALQGGGPIIATDIDSPVASHGRISIVLTHGHLEAQFLAGVVNVPTLYQGASCLGCMIQTARAEGFRLLIQS